MTTRCGITVSAMISLQLTIMFIHGNCEEVIPRPECCRGPEEADAQTLRTAVLLDELDLASYELEGDMHGHGPIIAEAKTTAALPLMSSYCSKRIVAVPTNQLNARR